MRRAAHNERAHSCPARAQSHFAARISARPNRKMTTAPMDADLTAAVDRSHGRSIAANGSEAWEKAPNTALTCGVHANFSIVAVRLKIATPLYALHVPATRSGFCFSVVV